jgi:hypothetical protein
VGGLQPERSELEDDVALDFEKAAPDEAARL